MKLLVLGGTRFVGRAVIANALERGWDITAVNRGVAGLLPPPVAALTADRTAPGQLEKAIGDETWDIIVDTWAGAPRIATEAACVLEGRAARYGYISTTSVYVWGHHVDERSPVVGGHPSAEGGDYAESKRGSEIGVLQAFPDALLARCGLILGPHEDIGRLPWWLTRIARGGPVVAPGRPERPLQYVDVRDLATWLLSGLASGLCGPVDVACRSGHATTADLLAACLSVTGSDARLVWVDEFELETAGVDPWTQLPCWVPETGEFAGFLEADTSRAAETGLVCRPIDKTVTDTWRWMQEQGPRGSRSDRGAPGLPPTVEMSILSSRSN